MALHKGDIVLVQFPFTDLSQAKLRPALVLYANNALNEITLCFISSQNVGNLTPEEFAINPSDAEFPETGLRVSSKVRVTRLTTLQNQLVVRRLGKLGIQQMQQLNETLIQVFQLNV
jgi:mRNA interferase MazF